jgi:hypothetical protein
MKDRHEFVYLFTDNLFNSAGSFSYFIESNERMIVNNELKRMTEKTAVVTFHTLPSSLPGGPERYYETILSVFSIPLPRMKPGICSLQDILASASVNYLDLFNDDVSTAEFSTAEN